LDVLSVRVNLRGETPPGKVSSVLFVANHVSWMDLLVMNACRRVRFLARAEVQQWPLLGWMATRTGAIFFKRTTPCELARVTKSVATLLRRGDCIALFPEGTTADGASTHAFHSGLFESAIAAEALIWPVGISYRLLDNSLHADIPLVGSRSLIASIRNILAQPATRAQVSYTRPIKSSAGDRHKLTAWCHQSIEQSLAGYQTATDPLRLPLRYPTDESLPPLTAA
jgi:1-acyl-sn-glycerol-3-phosphate acyltransferase